MLRLSCTLTLIPLLVFAQSGVWQKPGEIQKPSGHWQKPGEIQVPKGIQAIKTSSDQCSQRMVVGADALFEFDKSDPTPDATETLQALGPLIQKAGKHPVVIQGHTDSKGTPQYNQALSERRARAVKDWLLAHGYVDRSAETSGLGASHPIAPNAMPDGTDNPGGRQQNRRVEVIIDTCQGK